MSKHALLSPSSAYRWLNCPRAPRLEATLPEKISEYAKEGTLAHSVCEITALKHFGRIKTAEYSREIKKLKTNSLWNDEMLRTAGIYVEHLAEKAMRFEREPYIAFEISVNISDYVPEAFGRCDCIMFGDETLVITDYKHGRGESVSAKQNPQLMLYALGALKLYQPIFGNALKNIEVCIDQPRLNIYEDWRCTSDELLKWGESIKPKAQMAYNGVGNFNAGLWCKFCRANGLCKAQAEQEIAEFEDAAKIINDFPNLLTPNAMSSVLEKGEELVAWYESVRQKALEKMLNGEQIPGFKLVEGRSTRVWSNQDKALEILQATGIEKSLIFDTVPKTLAQLEKLIGATKFKELVGEFVVKPPGKPTIAKSDDARKEFSSAVADFASVVND